MGYDVICSEVLAFCEAIWPDKFARTVSGRDAMLSCCRGWEADMLRYVCGRLGMALRLGLGVAIYMVSETPELVQNWSGLVLDTLTSKVM